MLPFGESMLGDFERFRGDLSTVMAEGARGFLNFTVNFENIFVLF